jgi:predicted amidohydrolase YtcJ
MPGGRLLNRDDLDKAFPNQAVLVGHVSLHGGVLNSSALKKFGFSAATKTPPGGIIVRKPGTNEPYGLIMETAFLPVFSSLPAPTPAQEVEWTRAGQRLYAAAGITPLKKAPRTRKILRSCSARRPRVATSSMSSPYPSSSTSTWSSRTTRQVPSGNTRMA